MHDLKYIRENSAEFIKKISLRGISESVVSEILDIDQKIKTKQVELQDLSEEKNKLAKEIGLMKSKGQDASGLFSNGEELKSNIDILTNDLNILEDKIKSILEIIPNILDEEVPVGKDENDNVEIKVVGTPIKKEALHHYEVAPTLMDFESAAKISGSRFVILKKDLAQMERALANFMLDSHINDFGYSEISAPVLVKEDTMYKAGQLPKFDQDSFKTTDGMRLIPTSEVTLSTLVADSIVNEEELPLRYTSNSLCFRSEAGSAGKDTRGMIRVHQFSKVELVSLVRPQDSKNEHERMLSAAEAILQKLGLAYRVILLCTGDTGFCSHKTYDIEVWLPAQKTYREISSCSNCIDFQARRMKARYKELTSRKNLLLHSLNGSGLAIGRTIVAILENYQNSDGSIDIPEKLQQYMNGKKKIF